MIELKKMCLWNIVPPSETNSENDLISAMVSQGHKVIDLGVIWKGRVMYKSSMHTKYEVSITYGFKVIAHS